MTENVNPYEASQVLTPLSGDDHSTGRDELAGRLTRFAAAFLDGLAVMVIIAPVQYLSGYTQRAMAQEQGLLEQLGMTFFGMAVMFALNGYLLATRGQTIGKLLTSIQIVDANSGLRLPFMRVYVYRYLWSFPLGLIVALIPGVIDDQLFGLVVIIDILLIFGPQKRCLHDYIAGSKVVQYQDGRNAASN